MASGRCWRFGKRCSQGRYSEYERKTGLRGVRSRDDATKGGRCSPNVQEYCLLSWSLCFLTAEYAEGAEKIFRHIFSRFSAMSVVYNYSFAVSSVFSMSFIRSFSLTLKCRSVLSATIFCITLAQAAPLQVLSFSSTLTNCTPQYRAAR